MKEIVKTFTFTIITTIFVFLILEGISSTIVAIKNIANPIVLPKASHAKFDELLGWSSIPDFESKEPEYIKINSQSFRNDRNFTYEVPKGKTRIICSGDSFTFGTGVSNGQTWCDLLTTFDNNLETINMGQEGFGIDQAYLWHMRDGIKFKHNIHIFAFITDDFYRMREETATYINEPSLKLINGNLINKNLKIPFPQFVNHLKLCLFEYIPRLNNFRFYNLLQKAGKKLYSLRDRNFTVDTNNIKQLSIKIFETLNKQSKETESFFLLVYLPDNYNDINHFYHKSVIEEWRAWLKNETSKRNILYLDLYDEFSKLSEDELDRLFLKEEDHYSEEGNAFVAKILYEKLDSLHLIKNKVKM